MTLTDQQKKISKIAIPAVVIVLIIIIALAGGKNSDKKDSKNDNVAMTTAESMQTVVENDFEYAFEGIRWNYAPSQSGDDKGAQTKVGFFFTNFTRHTGGTPVSFARPYHIGWYPGDCSIKTEVPTNSSISAYGIPLAFTECTLGEDTTFVGLFQDGDMVTAYSWNTESDTPKFIREIDITTVVRSGTSETADTVNTVDSFDTDPTNSGVILRRRSGSPAENNTNN